MSYRQISVVVSLENYEKVGIKCMQIFSDAGIKVADKKLVLDQNLKEAQINYTLMMQGGKDYQGSLKEIFNISGVQKLNW